ncbi:hypothetical protein [Aquiflexum lacus]|uniref:hypothetical protein n=1 Tax=Aquiflexum lacus TaxID=2483805 RepID=UPI001894849A|nr:hypothetical protein [Aquiflexum lacus]
MTEREFLKSEVLKGLYEELIHYDYILIKSTGEFVKKSKDGWFKYSLLFLIRDEGWEINPTISLRINLVEEIYHTVSGFEKKYQKGTPTLGTSVENYINDGQEYRFRLVNENQINKVVSGLTDLFKKVALPFYQRYSSIEALDKVLNENPSDSSLTGAIFKGAKGLILAKLTKRSDYPDLVKVYTSHYEQLADGFYLKDFEKLILKLDSSNIVN